MELLKRKIDMKLAEWKKYTDRLPLIVKGAHEIGKTESVSPVFLPQRKIHNRNGLFVRDTRSLIPVEVKASDRATASLNNLITREKYGDISYGIKFCGIISARTVNSIPFPISLHFCLKDFCGRNGEEFAAWAFSVSCLRTLLNFKAILKQPTFDIMSSIILNMCFAQNESTIFYVGNNRIEKIQTHPIFCCIRRNIGILRLYEKTAACL